MIYRALWCSIAALAAIMGCSRQETVACEPDARYMTARSAPPVQIPDDLSPPDEDDALRLPPDGGAVAQAAEACLESPPSFFGESRPFQRSADAEEPEPAPREQPAQSEPAPDAGDRSIDN
jgi:hypothetical protein